MRCVNGTVVELSAVNGTAPGLSAVLLQVQSWRRCKHRTNQSLCHTHRTCYFPCSPCTVHLCYTMLGCHSVLQYACLSQCAQSLSRLSGYQYRLCKLPQEGSQLTESCFQGWLPYDLTVLHALTMPSPTIPCLCTSAIIIFVHLGPVQPPLRPQLTFTCVFKRLLSISIGLDRRCCGITVDGFP